MAICCESLRFGQMTDSTLELMASGAITLINKIVTRVMVIELWLPLRSELRGYYDLRHGLRLPAELRAAACHQYH